MAEISVQTVVSVGGFVTMLGGLLWNFAYTRGRDEELASGLKKDQDQIIKDVDRQLNGFKSQVQKMWDWKDTHEDKDNRRELSFQKDIGRMEAESATRAVQFTEVLRSLGNIDGKVNRIERRLDDLYKTGGTKEAT